MLITLVSSHTMMVCMFNQAHGYVQNGIELEVTGFSFFPFVLGQGEVKFFCIPGSPSDNCYTLFLRYTEILEVRSIV